MIKEYKKIRIDLDSCNAFPALVDYDFKNMRPRGGSSRIDFFSFGRLSSLFENVRLLPDVFVKKNDIFFDKGLFLVDFSRIDTEAADIINMILNLNEPSIFIENSSHFSIEPLLFGLSSLEITLIDFSEQ